MDTGPRITARFLRDTDERPLSIVDASGTRQSSIELAIEGAPEDATGVTYLIHESYFDPIRESQPGSRRGTTTADIRFPQEITCHGDPELSARIETPRGSVVVRERLSRALWRGEGNPEDPPAEFDLLRMIGSD